MSGYIFDLESDGLYDEVTKIHCVSYTDISKLEVKTITDYPTMRKFFQEAPVVVGHDICRYDLRVVKKILGVEPKAKVYDTLPMSWVMNTDRLIHGLDSFGKDFGIPKPKIDDWKNLSLEEYTHRCEEDVKINWHLWNNLIKRFRTVYGKERELMDTFFQYLTFKMQCAAMAEDAGWTLDKDLAQDSWNKLDQIHQQKTEELAGVMPMNIKFREKKKPKIMKKKDGSWSKAAQEWFELLEEQGFPSTWTKVIKVFKSAEPANPNSPDQVKSWLFSLGWEPCTYDYKKDEKGNERKIPQVRKDGQLTESVLLLAEEHPEVKILDGLTVAAHRRSIFESMLNSEKDGKVRAEINGLTNTLRFKHRAPLVNLPGVDKEWGKEVRGCLVAPEGFVTCGADMVSLESTTKRHFIFPYDPEYVAEMSQEGFDEHLDLAVKADYLTKADYEWYIRQDEDQTEAPSEYKRIKKVRKKFKPVNYSSVYGVGKLKLSRTTGMSQDEAQTLLDAYWERNWAVKAFAEDQEVKTVNGQMWVRNPVNKFWYTLRYKKDIFSTINQGTGAYCFDTWVAFYLTKRPNIVGQFHDESINIIKDGEQEEHTKVLKWAIDKVNQKLKLNIDLDIDVVYGHRYSDVH